MTLTDWDYHFLDQAEFTARRSKDPSTKVGAVIVRPDRTVVSTGFNGFPRRVRDLPERYADRPTKYALTVHAEINAIITAREPLHFCTLYVAPLLPCSQCAAAIVQAGISEVVARMPANIDRWTESFNWTRLIFEEAGVSLTVA